MSRGGGGRGVPEKEGAKEFVPVRPHNLKGQEWEPKVTLGEGREEGSEEDSEDILEEGQAGEVGVQVGNFRADDFSLGEYGFPDDGYDYSQHFTAPGGGRWFAAAAMGDVTAAVRAKKLTDIDSMQRPVEPLVDFGSKVTVVRSEVQVFEKHQFSDPDEDEEEILKALEDSQSGEEGWELADDFVATAIGSKEGAKKTLPDGVKFADAQFEDDDDDSDYRSSDGDGDEGKGRGDSRVVQFEERRTNSMVDDWLQHMMATEYNDDRFEDDEEEVGVRGGLKNANDLDDYFTMYLEQKNKPLHEMYRDGGEIDAAEKAKIIELAKKALDAKEEKVEIELVRADPQWDCESILTTYTSTANQPQLIQTDKKAARTPKKEAAPVKFREEDPPVDADERGAADAGAKGPTIATARKKDETPEEKKARKAATKVERRKNREKKKETKEVYKTEMKVQKKNPTANTKKYTM